MSVFLRGLLLTAVAVAAGRDVTAQPPKGSQLSPEENSCATCHGEPGIWEEDSRRLYISKESLAEDVHFLGGVNCHDCHGGNPGSFDVPEAHATNVGGTDSSLIPFRAKLDDVRKACGNCHEQQRLGVLEGVHDKAGEKDERGVSSELDCGRCHGAKAHGMVAAGDSRSPVFLDGQVKVCGDCHEKAFQSYDASAHGRGLYASGLSVTAVCADCHGAHGIYRAREERSTLHATNVAATCATCHRFIEERLAKSVHGGGNGPGGETEKAAPGGDVKRKPSCTDCHQGHDPGAPGSARFRRGLPSRCAHCHVEQSSGYAISMHGELTELDYGPAAMCADCHGAHDILPMSSPDSKLSPANRQATCAECHPHASRNFARFDPHADHRDPKRNLLLYLVYMVLISFLISTFSFFGLHSILWFVRSLVDVMKNGRPKPLMPGAAAYVRFSAGHRVAHTLLVISFLGLAVTGLPLKYSHYRWAQTLAYAFGGFESTGVWHRLFGLVNIAILAIYVFRMLGRWLAGPGHQRAGHQPKVGPEAWSAGRGVSRTSLIFGPDSPVPNLRDLKDFLKMIRWFFGLGPKPTFERWSYWEKYDFWGACADIVVIGLTGLVLWFPALFCAYLPGQVLNIAKVIHSTQALLATGFVFAIHFFNTHLRPEKFPMDMSILTGLISEEDAREERPEYLERMRQAGKLDELRTTVPSRPRILLIMLGGMLALAIGLGLLAGILLPLFAA